MKQLVSNLVILMILGAVAFYGTRMHQQERVYNQKPPSNKNDMTFEDLARSDKEKEQMESLTSPQTNRKFLFLSLDGFRPDIGEGLPVDWGYTRYKLTAMKEMREKEPESVRYYSMNVIENPFTTDKMTQAYTGRKVLSRHRGQTLFKELVDPIEEDNSFYQLQKRGYDTLGINGEILWETKYRPYMKDVDQYEDIYVYDDWFADEYGWNSYFKNYQNKSYDAYAYHVSCFDRIHHGEGANVDHANEVAQEQDVIIK